MKSYSSREIIKMLQDDGWYEVSCVGDHHQFKHPTKKGRVTDNPPEKGYPGGNSKKHREAVRGKIPLTGFPLSL